MEPRLRFLQFSDLHLARRMVSESAGLAPDRAREREAELRALPGRIAALARSERVDVVLAPGDLFDVEGADDATTDLLFDAIAALAPIPVVVAPGNHDPFMPLSPWAPAFRHARGARGWPENLCLFTAPVFETRPLPGRPDVAITGIAHVANRPLLDRVLARPVARPAAPIALLVCHGSLLGAAPLGKRLTLPFPERELVGQGFTYAALAHYHERLVVRAGTGRIRGAYAGAPAAEIASAGEPGVLIGEIAGDVVALENRSVDGRRAVPLEIQEASLPVSAAWDLVRAALAAAAPRSAEGRFAARLLAWEGEAVDADEREIVRAALTLGREALRRGAGDTGVDAVVLGSTVKPASK